MTAPGNFDKQITREKMASLIQEQYAPDVFQGMTEASAVMRRARRLPNMAATVQNMPVLNALPYAYFVNGDTGLKQTSEAAWKNVQLVVQELAVIVPIPEAVLNDSSYDIWGNVKPLIGEAFGKAFDEAVLFGTDAPISWPTNIVAGAIAAGNSVVEGSNTAGRYQELLGEDGVIAKVEADGYLPNAHLAAITMRAKLRGTTDLNGQPLFGTGSTFDGNPIDFPKNGSWDATKALMITGDFSQLVYSMRQDLTFKLLEESVIQDNTGAIIYNLAQQDMVALRAVMRLAWALPNPVNRIQSVEANRYPFSVYLPPVTPPAGG